MCPAQWAQTPARGAVHGVFSISSPPTSSVAWPLRATRHLLSIPPSAAAFAGLWEASFSTQPVLPSPSKFMVFEAEEEMHIQKLLLIKGMQGMPLLAPPRPDSWGPQMSP